MQASTEDPCDWKEKVPAGHALHAWLEGASEKVPTGHGEQFAEDAAAEKKPGLQGLQESLANKEDEVYPAGQFW
jgi:hypothetical protein